MLCYHDPVTQYLYFLCHVEYENKPQEEMPNPFLSDGFVT